MKWVKVEVLKHERVNMEVQKPLFHMQLSDEKQYGLKNGPKQNSSVCFHP